MQMQCIVSGNSARIASSVALNPGWSALCRSSSTSRPLLGHSAKYARKKRRAKACGRSAYSGPKAGRAGDATPGTDAAR